MYKNKSIVTTKTLTLTAVFVALSVVGAYIKLPSPTGTVALDALPGFLASLLYGPFVGCISIFLGHVVSSMIVGFPLTLPMHLAIGVFMALAAYIYQLIGRRGLKSLIVASVVAIIINGPLMGFLVVPIGGMPMYYAMVGPLTLGAAVNIILSSVLYQVAGNRLKGL